MKAVKRKGGVKKRNRRSERGMKSEISTKNVKNTKNAIHQRTRGSAGKKKKGGDMIRTLTEEIPKPTEPCNMLLFLICYC